MVTNRRVTQEAHERFNIDVFLGELNRRCRSSYRVVSEPNPPEAIIQSKGKTSWVEVTSAFMSREFAEDAWTFATPGEKHRPMRDEVIIGPDAQFAANFVSVVKKKLEKKSYEPFRDSYGPGYLVVSVQHPLFDGHLRDTCAVHGRKQRLPISDALDPSTLSFEHTVVIGWFYGEPHNNVAEPCVRGDLREKPRRHLNSTLAN